MKQHITQIIIACLTTLLIGILIAPLVQNYTSPYGVSAKSQCVEFKLPDTTVKDLDYRNIHSDFSEVKYLLQESSVKGKSSTNALELTEKLLKKYDYENNPSSNYRSVSGYCNILIKNSGSKELQNLQLSATKEYMNGLAEVRNELIKFSKKIDLGSLRSQETLTVRVFINEQFREYNRDDEFILTTPDVNFDIPRDKFVSSGIDKMIYWFKISFWSLLVGSIFIGVRLLGAKYDEKNKNSEKQK